jgi:hypothetical protein
MTRTTFLRRTTLHFGQIRLTDERTFMADSLYGRFVPAYFRR